MTGFKDSLKDALRQLSRRTSVESLKSRGVREVSVLGLDRIVVLVETAVGRALRSRLGGVERVAIEDAAKAEFLRLLKSNESLQQQKSVIERQKDAVEEELDLLRRELGDRKRELELRLEASHLEEATRYEGENAAIALRLADALRLLAGQKVGPEQLHGRVLELVIALLDEQRHEADQARFALRDREVENLQRRIAKLSDTLTTTEQKLQTVTSSKQVEQGISSIYREVQGIRAEEEQGSKKQQLMADLFKANLALQKKRSG